MNGAGHRAVAAATAVAALHVAPLPWPGTVATVAVAVVTGGGIGSPDVDNTPGVKRLDRWLPDEWLGAGGPLGHRRLTHSWMLPVLLWWASTAYPAVTAGLGEWTIRGLVIGWMSHVAADAVVGAGGVPLVLWFARVGLHVRYDGPIARAIAWAAGVLAVWWGIGLVVGGLPFQPEAITATIHHLIGAAS